MESPLEPKVKPFIAIMQSELIEALQDLAKLNYRSANAEFIVALVDYLGGSFKFKILKKSLSKNIGAKRTTAALHNIHYHRIKITGLEKTIFRLPIDLHRALKKIASTHRIPMKHIIAHVVVSWVNENYELERLISEFNLEESCHNSAFTAESTGHQT